MAIHEKDAASIIQEEILKKKTYIADIRKMWDKFDLSNSGFLTLDSFKELVLDPEFDAFASSLELDLSDVEILFLMLSDDGSRPVDFDNFAAGCLKLKGHARSLDLQVKLWTHDVGGLTEKDRPAQSVVAVRIWARICT